MDNSRDKTVEIERRLQIEYQEKGFLFEDDIIDICIEYDLDLVEINNMCDRLLNKKMLVRDNTDKIERTEDVQNSFVDRSHLDYDLLLNEIKSVYPNCTYIIDEILQILPPQSKEWQTIIEGAKNGNAYARNRLIQMYLRTVMKQAYEYSRDNYCDFEDAFQDGVIGLMYAIDKFDITSPDVFPSYFPLWVRQFMQRYAIIKGTIMRYPVHYGEQLLPIVRKACEIMEDDNFEEAIEWVNEDSFYNKNWVNGVVKEHVLPYIPIPEELKSENEIDSLIQGCLREALNEGLLTLKEREREVLELRYGIRDAQARTLEEVGAIFNITRERVRQIEVKALEKMSHPSRAYKYKDFL